MARHYDFAGQSGALYRYRPLDDLKPVSPGGANYLFLAWDGDVARVIYVGETDSLHRTTFETWDEARAVHGAEEIVARLNITGAVRRAEQADLVGKHRPPMNPAPAGAARTVRGAKTSAADAPATNKPARAKASRKAG